MISNNQKKLIRQLRMKKYRDSSALFIAEGAKIVADMLHKGIKPHTLFCTERGISDLSDFGISSNITLADEPEMNPEPGETSVPSPGSEEGNDPGMKPSPVRIR